MKKNHLILDMKSGCGFFLQRSKIPVWKNNSLKSSTILVFFEWGKPKKQELIHQFGKKKTHQNFVIIGISQLIFLMFFQLHIKFFCLKLKTDSLPYLYKILRRFVYRILRILTNHNLEHIL